MPCDILSACSSSASFLLISSSNLLFSASRNRISVTFSYSAPITAAPEAVCPCEPGVLFLAENENLGSVDEESDGWDFACKCTFDSPVAEGTCPRLTCSNNDFTASGSLPPAHLTSLTYTGSFPSVNASIAECAERSEEYTINVVDSAVGFFGGFERVSEIFPNGEKSVEIVVSLGRGFVRIRRVRSRSVEGCGVVG